MERREVRWERMFPDELEAAFEDCPVVYLPYGLCEPQQSTETRFPVTIDS